MMLEGDTWTRLVRYLAGESSLEEQRRVEQWLDEAAEHRRLMTLLRTIGEASEAMEDRSVVADEDLDVQWRVFLEKAHHKKICQTVRYQSIRTPALANTVKSLRYE